MQRSSQESNARLSSVSSHPERSPFANTLYVRGQVVKLEPKTEVLVRLALTTGLSLGFVFREDLACLSACDGGGSTERASERERVDCCWFRNSATQMELSLSSHPLSPTSTSSCSSQLPKPRVRVSQTTLIPFRFQPPPLSTHLRRSLRPMDSQRATIARAADNGSPATSPPISTGGRIGEMKRVTKETNVSVRINLDGSGVTDSSTGIPFLDHMLDQLASHGLFDVHVRATGDIHIDDHHTNEDVALAIGTVSS
ncbi:imidazoleglycerol-phosphate dehydratase [Actinidia rufa]|uniref:imidazoleglycerol-phosphate dehydratase n=1 Tax=Actinidia rufa TaxID=165716 RepID=A0A7J0HGL8_9ERIC|nr:imidazoleglycerol-phosphate dehydratase [Actinidia rufa]